MRTYTHLVTTTTCEAQGCQAPASRCGIYRREGGAVLACSVSHARAADERLREREGERRTAR